MRILVTNDDGINSVGMHVLAQHLSKLGEVVVFAPSGEYSGAGAAIGHLSVGLPDVFETDHADMPDVHAVYHLDGPPALASLLACSGLVGPAPDIVVSGINPGWNVGHAVHFSGTIGACVTASVFDIPAIAVSQHTAGKPLQWATAATAAVGHVPRAMAEGSLLNINVPNLPAEQIQGTQETALAGRIPYGLHAPTMTEVAPGHYQAQFEKFGPFEGPDGTDTYAVEAGYVSVTRLQPTGAAASQP